MTDKLFYVYGNFYNLQTRLAQQNLIVIEDGTIYTVREDIIGKVYSHNERVLIDSRPFEGVLEREIAEVQ
jgi:hypothetical protein